jgi:ubiquitin-conjugating enzyme E2 D/E
MNSGTKSLLRLKNELTQLMENPKYNSTVVLEKEDQLYKWLILMQGPSETPYEAGVFRIEFKFPDNYPFKAPEVKFLTSIYHPNIKLETGDICQDVFASGWAPTQKVNDILEKLVSMLKDPSTSNPLETEICNEYLNNPKVFELKAREHTFKHATSI